MIKNTVILSGVLFSALGALLCRQTVNALLSLITTFIMSALFFSRLQIYFISTVLIIVYVGAVVMLFLYVVMFIDIKGYKKYSQKSKVYFIVVSALVAFIADLFITLTDSQQTLLQRNTSRIHFFNLYINQGDVMLISQTLYTYYGSLVLLIVFLLFVVIVVATDISNPETRNDRCNY
jgi:NADH:ubiquinone oxidoreductase subunit 6 (subunit J)